MSSKDKPFDPSDLQLPSPQLLTYYFLTLLLTGPLLVFGVIPVWFRYSTLKYKFEETGMRMSVGFLFRRESVTAYRRIQDIHVSSNVFQRWLGISTISIQTASGSATPEIVIEGVTEPEKLRDWLYERLRGAKGELPNKVIAGTPASNEMVNSNVDETTQLLKEIRDNLAEMVRSRRGNA